MNPELKSLSQTKEDKAGGIVMKRKRQTRFLSANDLQVVAIENPQSESPGVESEVAAISMTTNLKAFEEALQKLFPMGRAVILRPAYLSIDRNRRGAFCRCVFDILTPEQAAKNAERALEKTDD